MRKGLLIILAVLVLGAAGFYFGVGAGSNLAADGTKNEKIKTEQAAAPVAQKNVHSDLPHLPITKLDGTRLVARELKGKTVLVLFQPDCDHCQRETVQIRENLKAFDDYTLYFVSDAGLPQISQFAKEYGLSDKSNVHFAQASVMDIINTVGPVQPPSLFVYSEDSRLVKSFIGETPIEKILGHL